MKAKRELKLERWNNFDWQVYHARMNNYSFKALSFRNEHLQKYFLSKHGLNHFFCLSNKNNSEMRLVNEYRLRIPEGVINTFVDRSESRRKPMTKYWENINEIVSQRANNKSYDKKQLFLLPYKTDKTIIVIL